MKKFWSKLTVLLCLLAGFGVVFSGCSDGGSKKKDTNPKVETETSGITVPEVSVSTVLTPDNGATAAYEDSSLYIKFDSVPVVDRSSTGAVKIYKVSDDSLVDTIKPADEKLTVVPSNASYTEVTVKDQLISVSGKVVVIKPHAVLDNETEYYVIVDNGLISGTLANSGAMLSDPVSGSSAFAGITSKTAWKFTTRAAPTISDNKISIGKNKNFSTIQAGLNYLYGKSGDWTMEIDAGYYNERLTYAGSANLTMIGVDETEGKLGENTVVYWANCNLWSPSTRQRASFLWEGGDLTLKHLTFANTVDRSVVGKDGTQAETLYYDAKGKVVAYDCSFKSHQDTLLLGNNGGRGWFYKCYIEGDTDFIWGYPHTVLFEECQIRCLYDSAPAVTTHTSYIFASRSVHTAESNKGLVLFNSKVKVDNGVTAYFGRDSGADTQAAVVFNTFETIDSKLWYAGAQKYDEDVSGVCTVGYKDYGNVYEGGSVIDTSDRLEGAYGLSKEVAEREYCGRNAILNRGWDASKRKYVAVSEQWDLSALESEFDATEDASKSMIYLEPTYVPYLQGSASQTFEATNYKGETVDVTLAVSGDVSAAGSDPLTANTLGTVNGMTVTASAGVNGTATVTATKEGMSGIAQIIVIKQIVPATSATLAWDEELATANTIEVGDTKTVTVTYAPADLTDDSTTWTSSNTNVVRVTGSGALNTGTTASVVGFGPGTATITATNKATNTVSASIEVTVTDVYAARYLQEATGYTLNASVDHRDATIAANPVTYGFAGGVAVATLADADKGWGNNGYKFNSADVVTPEAGGDICWADFTIRAAANIKIKAITADAYCSATSNLRGIVYTKVGDGAFEKKGEVASEAKAMKFDKVDISTDVVATQTVTVRVAISLLEGKTTSKKITGVIGGVVIFYDIEGTPVPFPGADGSYNVLDYATSAEKTSQGTAIADGTSADGMVSWHNVTYHSDGYGLQILGSTGATITIKVGGPSVISMLSSRYSAGTITVTNEAGNVVASGSTYVETDKTPFAFLYTGSSADTLTVAFTGGTSYINTITVYELTTEKAEVQSVKISGADTVSTAAPVKFTATVEATYMASPEVVWSSSDDTIATVAADGTVTGKKAGTVTIKATSAIDSTKSDSVEVEITEDELKPEVGTTYVWWFAKTKTDGATECTVTTGTEGSSPDTFLSWNANWKSHSYGLQTNNGAELYIKVAGDVLVGWTGYTGSGTIDVTYGDDPENQTALLTNVSAANVSDSTYKWFIYKGEATTLTLKKNSGTSYFSEFTVKPWTDEVPAVTAVSVAGESEVYLADSTATYTAKVTSEYFADESLEWSVENGTGSATIDQNGVLTMVSAGTVTVKATSVATPSVSGSKTVTISAESAGFAIGETYDYNFIADSEAIANYSAMTTGSSGFIAWVMNSWQGDTYGYNVKTNNTIKVSLTGSAKIIVTYTYNDAGYAVTTTGSGTLYGLTDGKTGAGTGTGTFEFLYNASSSSEEATVTLTAQGQGYCGGVKIVSVPVIGATYDYNFLADAEAIEYYTDKNDKEYTNEFLTWNVSSKSKWQGDTYGYNVGSNDYFTVTVTGSATIGINSTYGANAYTITTTGSGTLDKVSLSGGSAGLDTITYTAASADEVCTITFTSTGQNYCSRVVVNP